MSRDSRYLGGISGRVTPVPARELIVLGTASQAPTRTRNHNGYVLRWDDAAILFDPGEGTQRQLTLAGVAVSALTTVCITHFHGDHSLGLAGILQRRSLDQAVDPLDVYFPASGQVFFDRLRYASAYYERAEIQPRPTSKDGEVATVGGSRLIARHLDHRIDTLGWRLEEPDSVRMLPERLTALGITGPDVGVLQREGSLVVDGTTITLDNVSVPRPGQVFAFVMDTRVCDAASELAAGADLLVCEATFLTRDEALAHEYGHLTARQAAHLARDAGVRRLVLTHLSQRYGEGDEHFAEAVEVFPDVTVVRDLDRVPVPPRRA